MSGGSHAIERAITLDVRWELEAAGLVEFVRCSIRPGYNVVWCPRDLGDEIVRRPKPFATAAKHPEMHEAFASAYRLGGVQALLELIASVDH